MTDVDLVESREARDRNITRTEVLDKVKALTMLPGDTYVTGEMVASYYEVDVEVIRKLAQRAADELSSDGYRLVEGQELLDIKSSSGIGSRARVLSLFPRRAVLRVGMLLRDSDVAHAVRDHLLDAEQQALPDLSTTDGQIQFLSMMLETTREKKALEALTVRQALQLEAAAPKAAYVDQFVDAKEDATTVGMFAIQLGVTEPRFRAWLVARHVLWRRVIANRWDKKTAKLRPEYEWRPKAGYVTWFRVGDQPEAPRLHNGQLRTTLYVTPVGKQGIARLVERHPIDPNGEVLP
jgi:phage antirepressor YoqD-like protein